MEFKPKILVICVDRDNDIGEKASLHTPIIGREASLSAAIKLALADSEESDINAIFEAIKIYDRLTTEEGAEVEVVLIAGDKNVGIKSDRRIVEELDKVLSNYSKEGVRAIVVTDGAEDEWVLPIVHSRMKIDSLRRVVVKQSENLESSFYVLKKVFEDPKFSRTFFLPVGLILLAFFFSLLIGHIEWAIGIIFGLLGAYMLLKGLGLTEDIRDLIAAIATFRQSLSEGITITLFTYICALVIFLVGTLQGIIGSWSYFGALGYDPRGYRILLSMVYTNWAIWWYVGGALFPAVGKIASQVLEKKSNWKSWSIPFLIVASGLVIWGGSECTIAISENQSGVGYQILLFSILAAIMVSFIGVGLSLYLRSRSREKEKAIGEADEA